MLQKMLLRSCKMLGMSENEGIIGNTWKTSLNEWQVWQIKNVVGNYLFEAKGESCFHPLWWSPEMIP